MKDPVYIDAEPRYHGGEAQDRTRTDDRTKMHVTYQVLDRQREPKVMQTMEGFSYGVRGKR